MGWPREADRIIERGPWGTVEYAVRAGDKMEAKEWFEAQGRSTRQSFAVLFKRLLADGRITNETQCRKLRDTIWEFKRGSDRLLFGHVGRRRLLTHHYPKGGQKCPKREIDRAERIINEHIEQETQRRGSQ